MNNTKKIQDDFVSTYLKYLYYDKENKKIDKNYFHSWVFNFKGLQLAQSMNFKSINQIEHNLSNNVINKLLNNNLNLNLNVFNPYSKHEAHKVGNNPTSPPSNSIVYILKYEYNFTVKKNLFKIGWSEDVQNRISDLNKKEYCKDSISICAQYHLGKNSKLIELLVKQHLIDNNKLIYHDSWTFPYNGNKKCIKKINGNEIYKNKDTEKGIYVKSAEWTDDIVLLRSYLNDILEEFEL